MFARSLFVTTIAILGFAGIASAQPKPFKPFQNNLGILFSYPPSTNTASAPTTAPIPGAPTVVEVIDLEGFHREDSLRFSQAAVNAAHAWEVAKQTKTQRDARYAFLLQRISDADYLVAKLIITGEKLAPKIEASLFKTSSPELDKEVSAWLAMFEKFRSAVGDADATRIEVAETPGEQQQAQAIQASNLKLLDDFANGHGELTRLRQILQ